MSLYEKAEGFLTESGIGELLKENMRVVIAFSGGADSSVLLRFFYHLKEKYPSLSISCAHMNHMIRGEESDGDEELCKNICEELGVPLTVCKRDIPAIAATLGIGLEECARNERYAFLCRVAEDLGGALLATAHNADDNLETLIFNLVRGSGTKGLSGITPIRNRQIIRPLLSCTSEEIRLFAKNEGIPFAIDSTNSDTAYTRNSIRSEIIPKLKLINPRACEAALRLSRAALCDCDFIEENAKAILAEGPLSTKRARELHPALLARVIMEMFFEKAPKRSNLSEANIAACKALIHSREGGCAHLPFSLSFIVDKDIVYLREKEEPAEKAQTVIDLPLNTPVKFNGYTVCLTDDKEYINNIDKNIYNLSLHEAIDYDRIYGKVFLRTRLSGDTFFYKGMNRKLKKFLCDRGVPRRERDIMPLICDSEGILAVPYIGAKDISSYNKGNRVLHIIVCVSK